MDSGAITMPFLISSKGFKLFRPFLKRQKSNVAGELEILPGK
jgi:hypothetical protein